MIGIDENNVVEIVGAICEYLDDESKKLYKNRGERRDFVLSIAINLLGNLSMHWCEDTLESKEWMTASTINKLKTWYEIVLRSYQIKKESH